MWHSVQVKATVTDQGVSRTLPIFWIEDTSIQDPIAAFTRIREILDAPGREVHAKFRACIPFAKPDVKRHFSL